MNVLGLTGGFHPGSCDAAAAIVRDGVCLATVEEERMSRVKNSFAVPPTRCIKSCLDIAGLKMEDIDCVVLYVESYPDAMREMEEHLKSLFGCCPPLRMGHHHQAHAASAYYASGFDEAAVVTFDWSGDGVSTSIWRGHDNQLDKVEFIERPNSLGVFYAAFTQFLGFERGDEYKVMGLASYGQPTYNLDEFLDVSGEVYQLNQGILNAKNRNMNQLVIGEALANWRPDLRRTKWGPLSGEHMNLAASVQRYFERAVYNLAGRAKRLTGASRLCIAGGGGLNCKSNGRLVASKLFDQVYLPPFPNDTGCAFGGAAVASAEAGYRVQPITTSHLGPGFSDDAIQGDLELIKCRARKVENVEEYTAEKLCQGHLVGWFQGRMEVGARALGARSILADPRDASVKDRINKYVKFREDFRPFAPSVLETQSENYFDFHQASPFMSFVAPVLVPNELPGITHVDGTARLHTVPVDDSPYARLLQAMEAESGYACVLNTSFNYMGQPIVCTPKEAVYTFYGTGLDVLVLGKWVVEKDHARN